MDDVAKIGAGLSDALQEALVNHRAGQAWRGPHEKHLPLPVWSGVGHVLHKLGLLCFVSQTSSRTDMTKLGEAVRSHLQATSRREG